MSSPSHNTDTNHDAGHGAEHGEHHGVASWFEAVSPSGYESAVHMLQPSYSLLKTEAEQKAAAELGAKAMFSSWAVCIVLIVAAVIGRLSLNKSLVKEENKKYLADTKLTPKTFFEVFVGGVANLSDSLVGKKNTPIFFWLFGGLFLYIWASNMVGVLPGGTPPSQSISNNLAMALVVTAFFTYVGLTRQKFGFIKHMWGPVWWIGPLLLSIELFSTFIVRPVSLSLRLFGNLNGDHVVLGIAYQLTEWAFPVLAMMLGSFVAFIQAFVFTLLSIIYVVFSLEHDDHH
jgi:F-type H+-transporting ATPase subunit a